ncbi:MAG: ABC transporter permease [Pseudomonadota bacterium]
MTRAGWVRLLVVTLAVGALEWACRIGLIDPFAVIPPSGMVAGMVDVLGRGTLTDDILFTLRNVVAALVLSVAAGFVVGVILHRLPRLRRALEPILASYYAVPVFIFYPLFIVIFGLNAWPLIMIGFLFAIVAVIVNTLNGFDRVPRVLFRTARVQRLGRLQEVFLITLPAAAPYLFTGLKLAVAYAFIGVVAGEFILSGHGMGHEIAFAYNNFDNRTMYGLMLFLILLVTAVNLGLHGIEQRLHARRGGR